MKLGFEEIFVTEEESGDAPFRYFTLNLLSDGNNECLISDAADVDNHVHKVSLFDNEELGVCYTINEVKSLYKALTRKTLVTKFDDGDNFVVGVGYCPKCLSNYRENNECDC